MSGAGYDALKDMVELEMYLVAQLPGRPWPMVPRRVKTLPEARNPYSNPIESSAANELIHLGFLEYTSNLTLVVSQDGLNFYKSDISGNSKLTH